MNSILATSNSISFSISDSFSFRQKALLWANEFDQCCFLDNNGYSEDNYSSYESLIGVGKKEELIYKVGANEQNGFSQLRDFRAANPGWLFGFLSYDLKNETEKLSSKNFDGIGLPDLHFFQPEVVLKIGKTSVEISTETPDIEQVFEAIQKMELGIKSPVLNNSIQSRISKEQYLGLIKKIKSHIQLGDIYEMNFCQEFYLENYEVNPVDLFLRLNQKGKAPYSAFYKMNGRYLICASPERFLKKSGDVLLSQPIKGTIQRGKNSTEDAHFKRLLAGSEKDRSENVMIVDLVRNDLARSCVTGSIEVEELFGIYAFEQVFQMISTIKGKLKPDVHFIKSIENAFPMGSMTGAPKVRAMQLIEKYEVTKRGLYSGAVGYITPEDDFDFNVVIRSMIYNEKEKYLSFQVGGAIVNDSEPEKEYEECQLKVQAIREVLSGK